MSRSRLSSVSGVCCRQCTHRRNKSGWDNPTAREDLLFRTVRDEAAALTEAIAKVEREIDERVAALYELDSPPARR